MKLTRWLVLAAVVLFLGAAAKADAVDPAIGVRGCTGGGCSIVVGPGGTFSTSFFGGVTEATFGFINNTGQTAVELDLVITPFLNTPDLTFACNLSGVYFNGCSPDSGVASSSNSLLIRYFNSGEGSLGGIPNDPSPVCGDGCTASPGNEAADAQLFVNGADFAALSSDQGFKVDATLIAAPVPEPASLILLSTGLGCVGLMRRRRNKKAAANSSL